MRNRRTRFGALLVSAALSAGLIVTAPVAHANTFNQDAWRAEFVELVNAERATRNLAPVVLTEKLNQRSKVQVDLWKQEGRQFHYTAQELLRQMTEDSCGVGNVSEILAPSGTRTPAEMLQAYKNSSTHYAAIMNPTNRHIGIWTEYMGNSTRFAQTCSDPNMPYNPNYTTTSATRVVVDNGNPDKVWVSTNAFSKFLNGPSANTRVTDPRGVVTTSVSRSNAAGVYVAGTTPVNKYNGTYSLVTEANHAMPAISVTVNNSGVVTSLTPETTAITAQRGNTVTIPFTIKPYHNREITLQYKDNGQWKNATDIANLTVSSANKTSDGYVGEARMNIALKTASVGTYVFRLHAPDKPWATGNSSPEVTVKFMAPTATANVAPSQEVIIGDPAKIQINTTNAAGRSYIISRGTTNVFSGTVPSNGIVTYNIDSSVTNSAGTSTYTFKLPGSEYENAVNATQSVTVKKITPTLNWGENKTIPFGTTWTTGMTSPTVTKVGTHDPSGTWSLQKHENNSWNVKATGNVTSTGSFTNFSSKLMYLNMDTVGTYNLRLVYQPETGSKYEAKSVQRVITIQKATPRLIVTGGWKNQNINIGGTLSGDIRVDTVSETNVTVRLQEKIKGRDWVTVWQGNLIPNQTTNWKYTQTTDGVKEYRFVVVANATVASATSSVITVTVPPVANPVVTGWKTGTITTSTSPNLSLRASHAGTVQYWNGKAWAFHANLPAGQTTPVRLVVPVGKERAFRVVINKKEGVNHAYTSSSYTVKSVSSTHIANVSNFDLTIGKSRNVTLSLTSGRTGYLERRDGSKWVRVQTVRNGSIMKFAARKTAGSVKYRVNVPATSTATGATKEFTVKTVRKNLKITKPSNKTINTTKNYKFKVKMTSGVTARLEQWTGSSWKRVQSVKNGTSVTIKPASTAKTVQYRIYFPQSSTYNAYATKAIKVKTVKTAGKVSGVKKGTHTVKRNSSKSMKITLNSAGQVQQYKGRKWVNVKSLKKGTTTYKFKASKTRGAKIKYRVVVTENAKFSKKTSGTITIKAK